eukprot:15471399-Alexandrium_andersonii.AAC.1
MAPPSQRLPARCPLLGRVCRAMDDGERGGRPFTISPVLRTPSETCAGGLVCTTARTEQRMATTIRSSCLKAHENYQSIAVTWGSYKHRKLPEGPRPSSAHKQGAATMTDVPLGNPL